MGKRARILIVANGYVPGIAPHGSAVESMARALRGDLDIVAHKSPTQAHQSRLGEARVFRVKAESPEVFERAVLRQLASESYDLVHVRGAQCVPALAATGTAPVVYEAVADSLDEHWITHHRAAVIAANQVLVPTRIAKQSVRRIASGAQVHHLAPAVEIDIFDWRPAPVREPILRGLFLGEASVHHDMACLLEAVAIAAAEFPLHVLVAGDPSSKRRRALRAEAADLGVGPNITVRGIPRGDGVPSLIAGSDIGLVTARAHGAFLSEGLLPSPLLEYWATHRAVITPDFPSIRELMPQSEGVRRYVPGNAHSLASALRSFAERPEAPASLDKARRRVRSEHTASARERALRELYESWLPGSQHVDPWNEAFVEDGTGAYAAVRPSTIGDLVLEDSGQMLENERTHSRAEPPSNPRIMDAETTKIDTPLTATGTGSGPIPLA